MKLVYKLLWPELMAFPCPICTQEMPLRAIRAPEFRCPTCGTALRVSNVFVRGLTLMPLTVSTVILFLLQVRPWWRFVMLSLVLAFSLQTIAAFVMILFPPEIEPCNASLSLGAALRKR